MAGEDNQPIDPPKQPGELETVLDALPKQAKRELLQVGLMAKFHHGPLPDPETLDAYRRIIPNAPEILLNEVVKQTEHRQEMERLMVRGQVGFGTRGQWMAFVLVIWLSGLATYLGIEGHTRLAGVVFVTTIGSVLGAFIYGKIGQRSQSDGKQEIPKDERSAAKKPKR